jgi:hypothetical protein
MPDPRPLHRAFALFWMDLLEGTNIRVEDELDVSVQQQFLDLVLTVEGTVSPGLVLPDGFDLRTYNLVTFKSAWEALTFWTICELLSCYVSHRKLVSPNLRELKEEAEFRLLAVTVRHPQELAYHLIPISPGVYDLPASGQVIRVVVVHQLPEEDQNALLHLFSAREAAQEFGREHHRLRSNKISTLLYQLYKSYREDPEMSSKLEEIVRQTKEEILSELSPEERVKGLPPEALVKGLPPEERVKGLPPEERVKGLSPEELAKVLTPEMLEAVNRLKARSE